MKAITKCKMLVSFFAFLSILCGVLSGCSNIVEIGPNDGTSGNITNIGIDVITDTSPIEIPALPTLTEAVEGEAVTADTDGTITFNGDTVTVSGNGITVDGTRVTVTSAGTYTVSGTLNDGQLIVNTADAEKVKFIFNGVSLHCSDSTAVYVVSAPKKVIIYTQKDSVNLVSDGETYAASSDSDAPSAAIFSMDDLKLDGEGTLYVTGNYGKGIMSKDDLEICGGNIYITAVDDGIRGKDSVDMTGGYVVIEAGADGLRSSNDSDAQKGYVTVSGGELYIKADQDGVQAETSLTVSGGIINIVCGGGSANASGNTNNPGDFPGGGKPGNMPGGNRGDRGGNIPPTGGTTTVTTADTVSLKGLKAGTDLIISGGAISVDSADDAIHSNGTVSVSAGSLTLASGDDGIHAETTLNISGGYVAVTGSYEGLEALTLNIEGGNISVTSSDDGINTTNGTSSMGSNPFGGGNSSDSNGLINIAGGNVIVNAGGDGIDSNGNISMSGGCVVVYGPTSSGNGALDYDGKFTLSGGTLLAVGSSGMAQKPTGSGQIKVISTNVSIDAGVTVCIKDASDNIVACFTTPKRISSVVYAAEGLSGSYSIWTGGTLDGSGTTSDTTGGLITGGTYSGGTKAATATAG